MYQIILIGFLFGGNAPAHIAGPFLTREACSLVSQEINKQALYGETIGAVCKRKDYHNSGATGVML